MAFILGITLLALGNWSYAAKNPILKDYFFGPSGLANKFQTPSSDLWSTALQYFDKPITYNILILFVALLCGLMVYVFLEGFSRGIGSAKASIDQLQSGTGTTQKAMRLEFIARWSLRSLSVIGWVVYWSFWLGLLLPFSVLAARGIVTSMLDGSAWWNALLGLLLVMLSLHIHVVFLRLIVLRPRVFGGQRAIQDVVYSGR